MNYPVDAVATPDIRPATETQHFSLYACAGIDMQLVYVTYLGQTPTLQLRVRHSVARCSNLPVWTSSHGLYGILCLRRFRCRILGDLFMEGSVWQGDQVTLSLVVLVALR